MSDTQRPILVFGATGQQGGSVVRALLQARWPVRALVRDPETPVSTALRDMGVELVQGSYDDIDVIRSTMQDAYGVFSVLPSHLDQQDEVRFGRTIADLAVESGIAHLVYSSGASVGEKPTGVPRFDAKPRIEAHIRELPITATIVRPMIFMEMLVKPGYGLDEDRYTFFLRQDQSMQLIAVDDIGKFVAAVFADKMRFAGKTLKIASDTVTGRDLEAILTEAVGRSIAYAQFTREDLAANPDLGHISASLEDGPLADHVDMDVMHEINPEVVSFRSWLADSGQQALEEALGTRKQNPLKT